VVGLRSSVITGDAEISLLVLGRQLGPWERVYHDPKLAYLPIGDTYRTGSDLGAVYKSHREGVRGAAAQRDEREE